MTPQARSRMVGRLVAGLALALAFWLVGPDRAHALDVGQPAPDFKLPSTFGKDISLGEFRGKKWILLEFYGADFAPA